MKKFLIAAALMFAVPAQAQISEDVCVSLGDYAGKVMQVRQAGGTKTQVMVLLDKLKYELIHPVMVSVVDLVYAMPMSTSPVVIDELVTAKCIEQVTNDRYPANT
jgi:hypothetical protein